MSYDETPAQEERKETVQAAPELQLPLTRVEREEMKALSVKAFGVSSRWNSMLRKGELRPAKSTTAAGDPIEVKRLHHFTVNEIKVKMESIINEREEAQKAAEAAQKADEAKNAVAQESVQTENTSPS